MGNIVRITEYPELLSVLIAPEASRLSFLFSAILAPDNEVHAIFPRDKTEALLRSIETALAKPRNIPVGSETPILRQPRQPDNVDDIPIVVQVITAVKTLTGMIVVLDLSPHDPLSFRVPWSFAREIAQFLRAVLS